MKTLERTVGCLDTMPQTVCWCGARVVEEREGYPHVLRSMRWHGDEWCPCCLVAHLESRVESLEDELKNKNLDIKIDLKGTQ